MTDARARAEAQLQENRKLQYMTVADRAATKIDQFDTMTDRLQEMVDFHDGFRKEHLTLLDRVNSLLGVVSTMSAGRPLQDCLPPGTAPAFKRQLVELAKHVRGN